MTKDSIDKRIAMDLSASALITFLTVYSIFGKPSQNYYYNHEIDLKQKIESRQEIQPKRKVESNEIESKGILDIASDYINSASKSIDDLFKDIFSKDNDVRVNLESRISGPVYPTETFSRSEIINIIGDDLYSRLPIVVVKNKYYYDSAVLDNLDDMFPVIYATHNALQMPDVIDIQYFTSLSRGESAFDSGARSNTHVLGLFQVTHRTFVRFLPEYRHLYYGPNKDIEKLKKLEKNPSLSAWAAGKYLKYLDKFLTKNDASYRWSSKREKQRKLTASYNAGEGSMQIAGYDVGSIKDGKYPYGTDARALSSYIAGLMHGDESYFVNYYKNGIDKKIRRNTYHRKSLPRASKR